MRLAAAANGAIKIQPIALGKNWGFGSHLPTQEDTYLLDLSKLDRIRSSDPSSHSVEIEPGVSQGRLDAWLTGFGRSHFFNVTGAGTNTSVIGNALERGIGYAGSRHLDLLELEIVLPGGRLLRTSKHAALRQSSTGATLGPGVTDLFCQSPFGVITAARIALFRRPERMGAVICRVREPQHFPELVDRISDLMAEGAFYGTPHVFNRERIFVSFAPHLKAEEISTFTSSIPEWTALLPLKGSAEVFRASADYLQKQLQPFGEIEIVSDEAGGTQLNALLQGRPSDFSHASVGYAVFGPHFDPAVPLDQTGAGLIHITPLLPLTGEIARETVGRATEFLKARGCLKPQFSLNVLSPRQAALIIPIAFDRRSPSETQRAQETASALLTAFARDGMLPYRLGLAQAECLPAMAPGWQAILQQIQEVFDPTRCMAASRYEPLWSDRQLA